MPDDLRLRDVTDEDLPVFFAHQADPDAVRMAAFTPPDPADPEAFAARWRRVRAEATALRTILLDGEVAGHVSSYEAAGGPEVTYWIGKAYWGRGVATRALAAFLADVHPARPLHARVAKDNAASLRVLQKCGFRITGEARGFAHARGAEIEEWLLTLPADGQGR